MYSTFKLCDIYLASFMKKKKKKKRKEKKMKKRKIYAKCINPNLISSLLFSIHSPFKLAIVKLGW